MPSPIGHALAGLTVHVLSARDNSERRSLRRALLMTVAATAADLDLLFRFVDGRNHHQAETHSIGAALLAVVAGCAGLTHLLLDYLGLDTHPPIGIMALWPFQPGYFKAPWIIFLDIGRTLEWATVRHDALAVAWEMLVLGPLLLASWRRRGRAEA